MTEPPSNAASAGPPGMDPRDPGAHLGLGRFVCMRASRALYWVLGAVFSLFAVGAGLTVASRLVGPTQHLIGASQSLAVFMGLSTVVYFCVRAGRTTYRFYELGAVRLIGRKPKTVIEWVEASEITYKLVRQNVHGIPVGTLVTIQLKTDDKRKIGYSGNHKTKVRSKGFFGTGPKEVVKIDELDFVRDLVSEHIADRMGDRLLAGESIDWCGQARLSETGLTPKRGQYKNELIPYHEIDREAANDGQFSLFRQGDERPCLRVQTILPNFWPGVVLLHRLIGASLPEGAETVAMEEAVPEGQA